MLIRALGRMDTEHIKQSIVAGATEIQRLYERIDATLAHRGEGGAQRDEWRSACEEFHRHYSSLAFPGGYDGAAERIIAGDPHAVESALCFLELRPYFFRSGYMYKQLMRKVKQAPLSPAQAARFAEVCRRWLVWRSRRKEAHAA